METPETKKNKAASAVIQTAIILFCLTVYAAGVVLFILPSGMIAAGATGLGLFAEHYFGIPLSGFVAIFNIAMFGLGWLELGKKFAATTLIATFYYPFILNRLSALAGNFVFTKDPMLCAIFAGVMIGFSLGIVIRSGASTGGMDIPPLVLQKRLKIPVSVSMYVFDVAILLSQLLFRDREKILYGIIMVMIYTVILDKMLMMGKKQVQAKIISEKYEAINLAVQQQLDRGTTLFKVEGGHLRKPSMAVVTVVSGRELQKLNRIVMDIDQEAFMVVHQVGEVRGRGFTEMKRHLEAGGLKN